MPKPYPLDALLPIITIQLAWLVLAAHIWPNSVHTTYYHLAESGILSMALVAQKLDVVQIVGPLLLAELLGVEHLQQEQQVWH